MRRFNHLLALLLTSSPLFAAARVEGGADGPTAAAQDARHTVAIQGLVELPDGSAAAGALVFTDRGGQATVEANGRYALEIELAAGAADVRVTAMVGGGGSGAASAALPVRPGASLLVAPPLTIAAGASCQPEWLPLFGNQAEAPVEAVRCSTTADLGSGPELFIGGSFTAIAGESFPFVARWDGTSWLPLGEGVGGPVLSMAEVETPLGPALLVGGFFASAGGQSASRVALWNGSQWSGFDGVIEGIVYAVAGFDDGSGYALYAGGDFDVAAGSPASGLARWTTAGWESLELGQSSVVLALQPFDDGFGSALYLGGAFEFFEAGSGFVRNVARWNGSGFQPLGPGTGGTGGGSGVVRALEVFDDGAGPKLYAAGDFTLAGFAVANGVARWNGFAWEALGSGFAGTTDPLPTTAHDLYTYDDGSGAALYAAGNFTSAGGAPAGQVARWDGSSWSSLGPDIAVPSEGRALTLTAFDFFGAEQLLVGGEDFLLGETLLASKPEGWSTLDNYPNDRILALEVWDDGTGPALYAAGEFLTIGGIFANRIARYDGSAWSSLKGGLNGVVYDLEVYAGANGEDLIACGEFLQADGKPASRLARWTGFNWFTVGGGQFNTVRAMTVHDFGTGPELVAGGDFGYSGPVGAGLVRRWNGTSWGDLGAGLSVGSVRALASHDDGSGPAVYAAGDFVGPVGLTSPYLARFDGTSWSDVGGNPNQLVTTMAVYDLGSGPQLAIGGVFTAVGGVGAARAATWDGSGWSAINNIFSNGFVQALAPIVDADGPGLLIAGQFAEFGGIDAPGVVRWDGANFSALTGSAPGVEAVLHTDAPGFEGVWAGGSLAAPTGDWYLGRFGGCPVGAGFSSIDGCTASPATLTTTAIGLELGANIEFALQTNAGTDGLAQLLLGVEGIDAGGCGLFLPGVGELLLALAPAPLIVGQSMAPGGAATLALAIPDDAGLVGLAVALQGVHVDLTTPGLPVELSQALIGSFY